MAAIAAAGIGAAGAIGGAMLSKSGGSGGGYSDAAQSQAAQAERAAALQWQMYQQARGDLTPWRKAGKGAVGMQAGLLDIPGYANIDPTQTLRDTPGYQFALNQGSDTLGRYAAARGMSMSGPQMKSLQTYGQGVGDQTYQQYFNNLGGLSTTGENAAAMTGTMGQNAANQMGGYYMQEGQSNANSILAQGLQRQSGYSGLAQGLGMAGSYLAPYISKMNWGGGGGGFGSTGQTPYAGYQPYSVGSDAFYNQMYSSGGY